MSREIDRRARTLYIPGMRMDLPPILALVALAALSSCGVFRPERAPDPAPAIQGDVALPPAGARSAAEFDTTTPEQRAAAAAPPPSPAAEQRLGTTIASLGNPAAPGFWLETPLVTAPAKGRVALALTGASVKVDLIPVPGPAGAGSRLSLPAMQLLGLPLTDLREVEVFRSGG